MSYRPRESNVIRAGGSTSRGSMLPSSTGLSSSQGGGGAGSTTTKKSKSAPEDDDDSILLRDDEIITCLKSIIEMNFNLADLKTPSPTQVQLVYEQLVDELMGVRRETVDAVLHIAMQEVDFAETHRESMSLMAFYKNLSRLMAVCDVRDFSFQDLLKPEYKRLKVHLSQIINFMRFRSDKDRYTLIRTQSERPEKSRARLYELLEENEFLQNEIERVKEQVERDEPAIKLAKEVNESLAADLRAMKKRQTGLSNDFEKERNDRNTMKQALQDRQYLTVKGKQECDKIRPYIVDSPEKLQQVITDMNQNLLADKNLCDSLERRIRALTTSAESFSIIEADVTSCIRVMQECEQELVRVEEMSRKVSRHDEILKGKESEHKDIEREEALSQRKLENLKERIERLRAQQESKREQAQRRMGELKKVYDDLSRERGEKNKDMERKKMKIEQIEKKIADLKENIEDEVYKTQVEMSKMKAHIESYIREMEQRINSIS